MSHRLQPLRPDRMSAEQRALYDDIMTGPRAQGPQHFALTADDGSLRGPFDALLRSPGVGGALQGLGAAIRYRAELAPRERELAILLVATHWDCDFERESHEAIARAAGFSPDEIEATRRSDASRFTGSEEMIARTVLELLAGDLSDELWSTAQVHLGEATIFELTTLVGYYSTLALQLRVFRVGS
ncbi:carboxymuconolactone decarboxylase family protein [Microbacterium sp. LRZ72]|uniref:carboxymuconolactone decarboxylase family protein n=1 Tax=Microbacterium sp. LRZ72 TaxID=2942481 RepID=UPI0029B5819B|nr:carboxymuconolactone decarboxylase family protein [Microbacterium sp. LRZ72]MDX2376392.1 carboxymuconolactone decarboxylase family protein [Microbacterium sp. LRZ72]